MTVGTKEYYVENFKQVLMTNNVTSESTSLNSVLKFYEEEISNSPNLKEEDKEVCKRNLQKAFKQTKEEIFGEPER